jgi:hypothetical protein
LPLIAERIFPEDYARTLAAWRDRFQKAWPTLMPLGFDERFRRLWEYYLAYCEAGFLSRNIDVGQMIFAKAQRISRKSGQPISGLPDIGALNCASRKHPTCVIGFTRYRRFKLRKSETSDLRYRVYPISAL